VTHTQLQWQNLRFPTLISYYLWAALSPLTVWEQRMPRNRWSNSVPWNTSHTDMFQRPSPIFLTSNYCRKFNSSLNFNGIAILSIQSLWKTWMRVYVWGIRTSLLFACCRRWYVPTRQSGVCSKSSKSFTPSSGHILASGIFCILLLYMLATF
jgi:hypothetical protein